MGLPFGSAGANTFPIPSLPPHTSSAILGTTLWLSATGGYPPNHSPPPKIFKETKERTTETIACF